MQQGRRGSAHGMAAPEACEGDAASLCGKRSESMSGKDDRNDLSGEGAVRPGLTATVALYAPAGSHSRRSLGQSAVICNL
eukprot:scaffold37156_cov42-Phaeocystis_antarctica.AAC.1